MGVINKIKISTTNKILNKIDFFVDVLIIKKFLLSIDNDMEAKITNERDANNSNLINVELTYTPVIPKISTNTFISFFIKILDSNDFFDKISQTPIPAKIIKIECRIKDVGVSGVACSATESTIAVLLVKNGLIAFKYLKLGRGKLFDSVLRTNNNDPIIMIESSRNKLFLILVSFLLIF
jgi:hypothetical protein